ncbi:MAG: HD domain-containing protein, partial [Candidatus Aureabacteria bacterium]|nr:HD domain-containing protein [Candidatus Auribacterota bacterium]
AAEIVLHHHEDYSGTGFPNGLKGEDISLGARILRIADAYDRMVNPAGDDAKQMTMDEAYRKIESDSIVLYDHNIVKKFKNVIDSLKIALREKKTISKITHEQLKEGMVIAADVKTVSGIFIFKKDEVVNSSMLERLKEYVKLDPLKEKISIYAKT